MNSQKNKKKVDFMQNTLLDRVKFAPEHLRAARGLLNWSREDLQAAAGVSMATIKNIELGVWRPNEVSHTKIVNAFSAHGVEFVWLNGFSRYGLKIGGAMKVNRQETTTSASTDKREKS